MTTSLQLNQSLCKGLAILGYIAAHNGRTTMTELARHLDMDKGTTRRFLATLLHLGYIDVSPAKTFSVSFRVLDLGYSAVRSLEWREIARILLERLHAEVGYTLSLCILDGTDVLYLMRLEASDFTLTDIRTGSRRAAYASSMGKMLLALEPEDRRLALVASVHIKNMTPYTVKSREELLRQMDEARNKGYAVSDREASVYSRAIAVPLTPQGRPLASISIAVPVDHFSMDDMVEHMLPPLQRCAAEITRALEHMEFQPRPATIS